MNYPPKEYFLIYSAEQIAEQVAKIGDLITTWAEQVRKNKGLDILTIPVLRGGLFFFADLVRKIKTSVEVVPGQATSYDPNTNSLSEDNFGFILSDINLSSRSVLLVDDICDSGTTLKKIIDQILSLGAEEVRSAVLINRKTESPKLTPDWNCFIHHGKEWLVGYGMDDGNKWRNLDGVYGKIL